MQPAAQNTCVLCLAKPMQPAAQNTCVLCLAIDMAFVLPSQRVLAELPSIIQSSMHTCRSHTWLLLRGSHAFLFSRACIHEWFITWPLKGCMRCPCLDLWRHAWVVIGFIAGAFASHELRVRRIHQVGKCRMNYTREWTILTNVIKCGSGLTLPVQLFKCDRVTSIGKLFHIGIQSNGLCLSTMRHLWWFC
jgi:hypothetical protein